MPPAAASTGSPSGAAGSVRRRFQVGGTVGEGAFYVERPADRELPDALRQGELCFVLATRQIGKSSLRLHAANMLAAEGVACVHLDLTALGTVTSTVESWYFGLTSEIADQLGLPQPNEFWDKHKGLGPVHAWSRYLDEEVLGGTGGRRIVVFIDELDAMLSLPFSRDDLFAAVRAFYDRRAERPEHERLTFCLLGVAAPGDLITDPTRTPFNIGRAIRLEDFEREKAAVLREGLEGLGEDAEALLDQVFVWTAGHPYMTLRLCEDLASARQWLGVDGAVRVRFLERGRTEDANLQHAARWFEGAHGQVEGAQVPRMLRLYRRLLAGEVVAAQGSDPVQLALRLTGLAAERDRGDGRVLRVRNRVFGAVFDAAWVRKKEAERAIVEPLQRWVEGGRGEDFLLSGAAFAEVRAWAHGREDLTGEEREFLDACARGDDRRRAEEDKRRALRRINAVLVAMITLLVAALAWALWQTHKATKAQDVARTEAARAEHEARVSNARRLAALADLAGASGLPEPSLLLSIEAVKVCRTLGDLQVAAAEQALGDAVRSMPEARLLGDHGGPVVDAVYSPNGALIVTASEDGTAWIWRADGRDKPIVLRDHPTPVTSVAFSTDSDRVLTASKDKIARIWRADGTGNPILLSGHTDWVNSAAFSRDGTRVLTASEDGTARIWRADGIGKPIVLSGHGGPILSAVFSRDGTHILTASMDRTARIWDADGHGAPVVLRGHDDAVLGAVFSPDGTLVLTASKDKTARIWQMSGHEVRVLRGHDDAILSAAFSPNGTFVLTASQDMTARIWRADGQGRPLVLRGHEGKVLSAMFSPDGTHVLTRSWDMTTRIWRADNQGNPLILPGYDNMVNSAVFSPDGTSVLTASGDGTAQIWRLDGHDLLILRGHDGSVQSAVFSPDGTRILTASEDKTARIWNADGHEILVLRGHDGSVQSAVFSPDGTRILTASEDKTARIWNADGHELVVLPHEGSVQSAVFSVDGTRILTAFDNTARIWNADGQPTSSSFPFGIESHGMRSAVFSPDGTLVLIASLQRASIRPANGQGAPNGLPLHNSMVRRAVFSPDGTRVMTAYEDGTVRIWRADGQRGPIALLGSEGPVNSAVFSSDGLHVVTASNDKMVRIWRADGQGEPLVLRGHESSVNTAVFSADGKRILTASADGTARVWTIDVDLLVERACVLAHRNLTRDEWSRFMPNLPYSKTCPEWPAATLPRNSP